MKRGKIRLIIYAIVVSALFIALCAFTAEKTFRELKTNESFDEVDYYSMQKYSERNSKIVFSALKSGKLDKIKKNMSSSDGLDEVAQFANWSEADFDKAVSLGAGSLSPKPDENGRIDVSERFFVDIGDERYVLFIETVTSRWGRTAGDISAVAVTSFTHFEDDLNWTWSGEKDDSSALAGKLFWEGNQPEEPAAEGE